MGIELIAEISWLPGWINWLLVPANLLIILKVAFGLGFVIFVHELGHFAVAKWCGVKCPKFYVGFDVPIKIGWGKYAINLPATLWKRQWGETEYGIGILPLGGYVKMLGQDDNPAKAAEEMRNARIKAEQAKDGSEPTKSDAPVKDSADVSSGEGGDEDYVLDPRSYLAKSVPQRMAIISAGVIMNIIFAVVFSTIAYAAGVPFVTNGVSAVVAGDAAWVTGIRTGDVITEINKEPVKKFKDIVDKVVRKHQTKHIDVVVERDGKQIEVRAVPNPKEKLTRLGVLGPRTTTLDDKKPVLEHSPAAAAIAGSFESGDTIFQIGSTKINNYADMSRQHLLHRSETLTYRVLRAAKDGQSDADREIAEIKVEANPFRRLGLRIKFGDIGAVQQGSPAAVAGIKTGDQLIKIDGTPVEQIDIFAWQSDMLDRVFQTPDAKVKLVVKRASETLEFVVGLRAPLGKEVDGKMVAISPLGLAFTVSDIVATVDPACPAAEIIKPGDQIVTVELLSAKGQEKAEKKRGTITINQNKKTKRNHWAPILRRLQYALSETRVQLTVIRDGKEQKLKPLALFDSKQFNYQRGIITTAEIKIHKAKSFGDAVQRGLAETKDALLAVFRFLEMIGDKPEVGRYIAGPIGIAGIAGKFAEEGIPKLLIFLTMISANLAVLNFLPIPILDGGHMVFLAYEGIRGKPADDRVLAIIQWIGLILILSLMVFAIGLDTGLIFKRITPGGPAAKFECRLDCATACLQAVARVRNPSPTRKRGMRQTLRSIPRLRIALGQQRQVAEVARLWQPQAKIDAAKVLATSAT